MDLPLLTGGTPDTKPWCNIVVNSITYNKSLGIYNVSNKVPIEKSGASALNLTPEQFVGGVTLWETGSTGNLVCPDSASIDALLDIKSDGYLITHTVINRIELGNQILIPPDAGAAQHVPNAQAGGKPLVTTYYFTRLSGVWTSINS